MTGIAFPTGSGQLYTGSKDETVRIWDCQSGQVHFSLLHTSDVASFSFVMLGSMAECLLLDYSALHFRLFLVRAFMKRR